MRRHKASVNIVVENAFWREAAIFACVNVITVNKFTLISHHFQNMAEVREAALYSYSNYNFYETVTRSGTKVL